MNDKRTVLVITFALIACMIVSAYVSYVRIRAEKVNNVVELTADYSDIYRLSVIENLPAGEIIGKLKDAGINSVAITEDLENGTDINLLSGIDPKKLNLYVPGKGLDGRKISLIRSQGLRVIPRIRNAFNLNGSMITNKINRIAGFDTVIFAEEEVLGYPNYLGETAKALKAKNIKYGFIEFGKQLGDTGLSYASGGNMVKVHSVPVDEMENLSREDIIRRYVRAARERNIRMLYIHLLQYPQRGKDLLQTNQSLIKTIRTELEHSGFLIGKASMPKAIKVTRAERSIMALGIAAGFILLASYFVPVNLNAALLLIILFAIVPSANLLALAAAIIFPAYAVISQFPSKKAENAYGFVSMAVSVAMYTACITAVGAVIIAALLSDKLSLLGVSAFTGVKAAFIVPILIVALYFFLRTEEGKLDIKGSITKMNELLNTNITLLHLAVLLAIAGGASLLILRSGNFGLPVPGAEKFARNLLENILFIRPRTKEFLIGYPALILASIYYFKGGSRWLWLLLSLAVLAPISLVNSFCHIHTPLLISVIRSCIGLILGIAIGLIAYFAVILSAKIVNNFSK